MVSLLPLIVGAALLPVWIIMALFLLRGESGSNLITSTLLLVLGIVMLISAVKKWRKEEDPDAPPKWMGSSADYRRSRLSA